MKLSKIFNVEICKNPISMEFAYENPGKIPYVTTTSFNNGVETFVDYPAQYGGGKITVSKDGGSADAFLQAYPFCGNEKVMVLSPKVEMTKKELLFYCYLINKNKYKFAYGRKCSVERINELDLIEIKDFPKWVNKVNIIPITTNNKLLKKELDINKRKEFRIGNIFKIDICKSEDLGGLSDGNIPFLGRTDINNGIQGFVDSEKITKGKCISVSMVGTNVALRQDNDFIASQNIATLRCNINRYSAMFICTLLNFDFRYKYSYGRTIKKIYLENSYIKLPVNKNGEPDREFMENYIKSLPYGDRI